MELSIPEVKVVTIDYLDTLNERDINYVFKCPLCEVIEVNPLPDPSKAEVLLEAGVEQVQVEMTEDSDWDLKAHFYGIYDENQMLDAIIDLQGANADNFLN